MDKGGFISLSNSCRVILGMFFIVFLPLLIYQNSSYASVWSLRKHNQDRNQTTPELAPTSSPAAQEYTFAPAPAPTGIKNDRLQESTNVSPPSQSPALTPKPENHIAKESRNVSTPSQSPTNTLLPPSTAKPENDLSEESRNNSMTESILLNGLISGGFDEKSCLSRYESQFYRKPSPHKPSSSLISKLRSYEHLHKRCGPKSRRYNKTLKKQTDCKYIVWLPANGLGNRMISLAATFLYAILTNRVLLVEFESEMSGVFCEPFLDSTWKLPHDFPHRHHFDSLPTYASLVKNVNGFNKSTKFIYAHLQHERQERERFFHCDEGQKILNNVPFLILMSDQYFAPSLFMIPSFKEELNAMFPEKDTIFHHLGRYLFNPSNEAWKQITRFYTAKFLKADKKVGIQVRVFAAKITPTKTITQQILACALKNNVLPKVDQTKVNDTSKSKKAVLVTSLHEQYSADLRAFYKTGKTTTGEEVLVYQPSHEETQRFNNNTHHIKALIDMYLLSLCDELVTSGQSTFGYVAQSLGAIRPWIMYKTVGDRFRNPPCERALSVEPCFHYPPMYDCERRIKVEHISSVFPHMRQCEDVGTGVKMVSEI